MEAEDTLLLNNRRNEAIYHGNIVVALMDHLFLTQEEKFYLIVVDGIVRALSNEIHKWDNKIPEEINKLIKEGDEEKMRSAMEAAVKEFEKARSEYEIRRNSAEYRKHASARSV